MLAESVDVEMHGKINPIHTAFGSIVSFNFAAAACARTARGSIRNKNGKTLKWNAAAMEITGNPEAVKLINPAARKGWRPEDLA